MLGEELPTIRRAGDASSRRTLEQAEVAGSQGRPVTGPCSMLTAGQPDGGESHALDPRIHLRRRHYRGAGARAGHTACPLSGVVPSSTQPERERLGQARGGWTLNSKRLRQSSSKRWSSWRRDSQRLLSRGQGIYHLSGTLTCSPRPTTWQRKAKAKGCEHLDPVPTSMRMRIPQRGCESLNAASRDAAGPPVPWGCWGQTDDGVWHVGETEARKRGGWRRHVGILYGQLREFTDTVCQHPPQEHDIHV